MDDKIIGKMLKDQRKKHACSKDYLASIIGVSRNTYARIESGNRAVSYAELKQILAFYHISIEQFDEEFEVKMQEKTFYQIDRDINDIISSLSGKMFGNLDQLAVSYQTILEQIEEEDIRLTRKQQLKIDYIYTLFHYKESYEKEHLVYFWRKNQKDIENDYFLLTLVIPILTCDELLTIYEEKMDKKIINTFNSEKKLLALQMNIISQLIRLGFPNKDTIQKMLDSFLEKFKKMYSVDYLILYIMNSMLLSYNIEEIDKTTNPYYSTLKWLLIAFDMPNILQKVDEEIDGQI